MNSGKKAFFMRLVTFVPPDGQPRAGALLGPTVIDLAVAAPLVIEEAEGLRWDMLSLLRNDQQGVSLETATDIVAAVSQMAGIGEVEIESFLAGMPDEELFAEIDEEELAGALSIGGEAMLLPLTQVRLLAPLPRPISLREFNSFEAHALTAARLRSRELPEAWYRAPAFSFVNHSAIYGPDEAVPMPRGETLDYALSLGCVIGQAGRDIAPEDAFDYIAGFLIINGWAARDMEEVERVLGTGRAKSRDFATSIGPWIVTRDELELYIDDDGRLSLELGVRVNNAQQVRANAAGMFYSFAELVAYASRDTTLHPGEILASGPVGGGTLLEQTEGYGPWLERGDSVELTATGLGALRNEIV